ncbi:hypothetical protein P9B03_06300 [Metasolibacillus meyeri]|uniref:Uncharacterized protein n=1 Tax=Metasolibacillus meyeri TaxID=1071052 RepID=A0AAW9NRW1_9BACL|nr:hypothetical protein [Metasolibacillus meyeri]MEC1178089.1 hypothetical protein [Metasolibacillus meyeri]
MSITGKQVFVSAISVLIISMITVGGSTLATFLFYKLDKESFGDILSTSRIIWFLIVFVLSFFFILYELDKKKRV